MPLLRVSLAVSVDGYVAEPGGGFEFLRDFPVEEVMDADYLDRFGALVMGRRTYDQLRATEAAFGWPYAGKPVFVTTSRPLGGGDPEGVEAAAAAGEAEARSLAERAKAAAGRGDVWLFGGPASIAAFERHGLVDRWELAVVPRRLGGGVPLFAGDGLGTRNWSLRLCRERPRGVVELHYEPGRAPAPAQEPRAPGAD